MVLSAPIEKLHRTESERQEDRDLQSMVAAATPKVAVKSSVKPKASVKVAAKTPAVKSNTGAAVKLSVPKLGVSAKKPSAGAKVSLGGNASTGAKVSLKAGGSTSAKASAVVLHGSCPMAKLFGMKVLAAPVEYTDKSICKDLDSTCCDLKSLKDRKSSLELWLKSLSAVMWSTTKFGNLAGSLLSNLNVQAKNCTASTPAPVPKKKRILMSIRDLQALVAKAPTPTPKADVKVAPKVGAKVGVKATTPKVGAKVGAGANISGKLGAKVPSIKVNTPKIKVSTPTVTLKLTLRKGENAWDSYKGAKVSTYSPTINANAACLASANMNALITGLIFSDDLTNFKNLIVPLYKAYELAVTQIGNEKATSAWAKFKGNKGIITISVAAPVTKVGDKVLAGAKKATSKLGLKVSAKPSLKVGAKVASPKVGVKADTPKVGVKVAAKKPAVKAGVKVSAKKSRRMQAAAPVAPVTPVAPATPNPSSTITMSSNGANLASYQNTGISPPSFEGDGQEASGKLMRAFSLFAIMLVAIFFN